MPLPQHTRQVSEHGFSRLQNASRVPSSLPQALAQRQRSDTKKPSCQLCDTPGNLMKRFAFVAHLLTRTDSGRATTFEEINAIHTRLDCGFNSGSSVCYFWMQWMQLHHSQWHSNNRFQKGWSLEW